MNGRNVSNVPVSHFFHLDSFKTILYDHALLNNENERQ